jgi:hypothetical protein
VDQLTLDCKSVNIYKSLISNNIKVYKLKINVPSMHYVQAMNDYIKHTASTLRELKLIKKDHDNIDKGFHKFNYFGFCILRKLHLHNLPENALKDYLRHNSMNYLTHFTFRS